MSFLQDPDAHLYAKLVSKNLVNKKPDRIVVVGIGRVGSQIAYLLAENGLASEIVLISATGDHKKAEAEAHDIQQANPSFRHPVKVRSGDYPDVKDAKGVIITAGTPRVPVGDCEDRMFLAKSNAKIMREIAYNMKPYITRNNLCKFIIVSNPVDVMTYAFIQYTGVPPTQVMGTGTMLETSRLTTILATLLKVSPKDITAIALGEHGKTVMIPWSRANVKGIPADGFLIDTQKEEIVNYVLTTASNIVAAKGYTSHAIATVTRELCEDIFKGVDGLGRVRTVSVLNPWLKKEARYRDINACLSFPCRIGPTGIEKIYKIDHLTREELHRLEVSAKTISDITKDTMSEYPPY